MTHEILTTLADVIVGLTLAALVWIWTFSFRRKP